MPARRDRCGCSSPHLFRRDDVGGPQCPLADVRIEQHLAVNQNRSRAWRYVRGVGYQFSQAAPQTGRRDLRLDEDPWSKFDDDVEIIVRQ
jgi:hypothetical protein